MALPVVILAGGLATRLRPITERIPKSLIPISDRPFIRYQLELLKNQGLTEVILCVGHLGEMVEAEIGDGRALGVSVQYSHDGATLRGTGGAIRHVLPAIPGDSFFVLYGDSYLPIDYRAVEQTWRSSDADGLMTVFRNENRWDSSNVWFEDGVIKKYSKTQKGPEMLHIDYGLSIFRRTAFDDLPEVQPFDLSVLTSRLAEQGRLAGYEVRERFYEIGTPSGIEDFHNYLTTHQTSHE